MTEAEAIVEAYDKGRALGKSEAAEEIKRLREHLASTQDELQGERWDNDLKDKEIERLRAALKEMVRVYEEKSRPHERNAAWAAAKEALGEDE